MPNYNGTSRNDYHNYRGSGSLVAYGYGGNDHIIGADNNDWLYGGTGNDSLIGWGNTDYLHGESGNDLLSGDGGNDWLQGSSSTTYDNYEYDTLRGGPGYDTFVLGTSYTGNFYRGYGYAVIEDYDALYDYIQVKGSASSFHLDKSKNLVGGAGLDTAIYSGTDCLGIVQDTTDLQLTSYYFKFV